MREGKYILHFTGKRRLILITLMIAGQGLVYGHFGQITLSHVKLNFILSLLIVV